MGLIPEDAIRQVLERSDIVEIISSYVPLKHAGRNFKALCPFHHEKTPSFVVNPEKQIFHCFGCGVGGNVFSFVMSQEHLDFAEAVRSLAAKAGIEIPQQQGKSPRSSEIRQELLRINQAAAEYYHNNLLSDKSPEALSARQYLKDRRVTLDIVKKFKLGLALNQWDGLIQHLGKKNISLKLMEKAGLIVPQQNKQGFYDRFRNRIAFPIFDVNGKTVAFGARAMESAPSAKYINSPETELYTKGHHLYGFHLAKEAVGRLDAIVVVEGYMDFIMPFQSGVQNIVASLGTALTENQIRLMRRFTKNIIMLFDADRAGESAMVRSLDVLLEEGMNVRVATLGVQDQDPDSFVRTYGVEKFQERIDQAESLFDFKLKFLIKRCGLETIENRAKISGEMLLTIDKFKDMIVKTEYLKRLSLKLAVSQDALWAELKKIASQNSGRVSRREEGKTAPAVPETLRAVERDLLRLMLTERNFLQDIRNQVELADFQNPYVRDVVTRIYDLYDQGKDVNLPEVMSGFPDQKIVQFLSNLLASEDGLIGDKKRIHRDCVQRLKQDRLKFQRRNIVHKMEQAREQGDHFELDKLTREFNLLIKG